MDSNTAVSLTSICSQILRHFLQILGYQFETQLSQITFMEIDHEIISAVIPLHPSPATDF